METKIVIFKTIYMIGSFIQNKITTPNVILVFKYFLNFIKSINQKI